MESVKAFKKDLAAMQKQYAEAQKTYDPSAGNFSHVPDGKYFAKEQIQISKSKAGKLMAVATYIISDGEYEGKNEKSFFILARDTNASDPDRGLHFLQKHIEMHNIAWPDKITDLEEIFAKINESNLTVEINIKTSSYTDKKTGEEKQGTNIYLNRVIDELSTEINQEAEPVVDQEDGLDNLDDMDRKALKEMISNSEDLSAAIRVTLKMSDDDIRKKIREAQNKSSSETENNSELLTFCASQGIDDVTEEMSKEDIIEVMKDYRFEADKLEPEELQMLEDLELSENIIQPAPVKKAAARIIKEKE
jgi:hypothetical protein